ncbi:iron-containing alcohol dehydrogenase, partial [Salmonella enterica]|nr:iron-containing alcohol dehydrogenase [Salmonella enterica]
LKELDALGCSRPAILAQDAMMRSTAFEALSARWSGLDHLRLPAVPRHSSVDVVETMAEKVRAFGADSLVAIGGGSVADSA